MNMAAVVVAKVWVGSGSGKDLERGWWGHSNYCPGAYNRCLRPWISSSSFQRRMISLEYLSKSLSSTYFPIPIFYTSGERALEGAGEASEGAGRPCGEEKENRTLWDGCPIIIFLENS